MKQFFTSLLLMYICGIAPGQNVAQLEFFIDTDKGFGKNTKLNVVPSPDSSFSFTIDLTGITEGYHKLYIRSKDSKGKWSITARRNITVIAPVTQNKIKAGEYFFDTDPGFGKARKIAVSPKDSAVIQDFDVVTAGLKPGFHKLYARFKDTYNNWSITIRRNVEIIKSLDTTDIAAAEYFFGPDPGFDKATPQIFTTALPDGSFSFKIPYNQIPSDADTLFIRVKDSLGNWSLTKLGKFSVAPSLQPETIAAMQDGEKVTSNSTPFSFSVNPNPVINGMLNVNIRNPKQTVLQVGLYDMQGKIIYGTQFTASAGSMNKQINVSSLAAGTYIVYVSDGAHASALKILKK